MTSADQPPSLGGDRPGPSGEITEGARLFTHEQDAPALFSFTGVAGNDWQRVYLTIVNDVADEVRRICTQNPDSQIWIAYKAAQRAKPHDLWGVLAVLTDLDQMPADFTGILWAKPLSPAIPYEALPDLIRRCQPPIIGA